MDCNKCHGPDTHGMLSVGNPASPVYLDHQVRVCGDCHESYLETYERSVHGQGLTQSGLVVTAVCADCHGAHGFLRRGHAIDSAYDRTWRRVAALVTIFSPSDWPEVFTANIVN